MKVGFDTRHVVAVEVLVGRRTSWKLFLHHWRQLLQQLVHLVACKQIRYLQVDQLKYMVITAAQVRYL